MGVGALHGRLVLYLVLLLAVGNISTASVLVRLAGVHGFAAATWRLVLGAVLTIALLIALQRGPGSLRTASPRDLALMAASGVALALHFGLWMMSLHHLSVAASVTIVDSYPAILALVGRIVFGELYTHKQLIGAALAMAGVAALAFHASSEGLAPPGGDPLLGSILSFLGMLAVASYFTIGKGLRGRYTTLEYTSVVYATAALVAAGVSVFWGIQLYGYNPDTYLYLILLALLPMLGGHTLINYALGRLSLLAATVPVLGEPVGASILAWIILGEPVTPEEAVLMAITLGGIALVLLGEEGGRRDRLG